MEKTYRGTYNRAGIKSCKLIDIEYNVAAIFAATERLSKIVKNFPKPPTGWSMASSNPPTFPPAYPVSQSGTEETAAATAAPRHWKPT